MELRNPHRPKGCALGNPVFYSEAVYMTINCGLLPDGGWKRVQRKSILVECCSRYCPRRKVGCKADCEDWKRAKAEHDALLAEVREERERREPVAGFTVESIRRVRKRRRS